MSLFCQRPTCGRARHVPEGNRSINPPEQARINYKPKQTLKLTPVVGLPVSDAAMINYSYKLQGCTWPGCCCCCYLTRDDTISEDGRSDAKSAAQVASSGRPPLELRSSSSSSSQARTLSGHQVVVCNIKLAGGSTSSRQSLIATHTGRTKPPFEGANPLELGAVLLFAPPRPQLSPGASNRRPSHNLPACGFTTLPVWQLITAAKQEEEDPPSWNLGRRWFHIRPELWSGLIWSGPSTATPRPPPL